MVHDLRKTKVYEFLWTLKHLEILSRDERYFTYYKIWNAPPSKIVIFPEGIQT
jgi:hypothetical protein